MYNEEYKRKYIEDNQDSNLNLELYMTRAFDKIAPFEERLGKDLYDFSTQEITDYYKYLSTPSFETLQVLNNRFKIYTTEALVANLVKDNQNHYDELTPELLLTCVNAGLADASIITREELCKICDHDLNNACDAFFVLALFEGIRGKENSELIELYLKDFDQENSTVKLVSGRELKISTKLYGLAKESATTWEYQAGDEAKLVKHFREDDARIIKMVKRSDNVDTLHNRCISLQKAYRKIKSLTDLKYTMNTLSESGRIDYIQHLMAESGLSLRECLSVYREDIEYRYGRIQCLSTYVLKYGKYFGEPA